MIPCKNTRNKGFTLMESVIAIGVVAILLTTFLAIFGPATQGIRRAISSEDADRLIAAMEKELSILREAEAKTAANPEGEYTSAFDKAYEWVDAASKGTQQGLILVNYRGDITDLTDGKPEPVPVRDSEDATNADYVVTPSVRLFEGTVGDDFSDELDAAVGPAVFVKTTQLVYSTGGELELGGEGIKPPRSGQQSLGGDGSDSYPDAVIAFSADFYLLPTNSKAYIEGINSDDLGKPLFTRNLAVRR